MKQRSQNIQWDIFQYWWFLVLFCFWRFLFCFCPPPPHWLLFLLRPAAYCYAWPRLVIEHQSPLFSFLITFFCLFLVMTVEPRSPLFSFLITFFCLFSWYKHLFLSFFISRIYWVNVKKKTWNSDLEILIGLCWDIFEILNRCMVEVAKVLMCLYFVLTILFVTQWGHRSSSITNSPAWLMFQSLPSHFV